MVSIMDKVDELRARTKRYLSITVTSQAFLCRQTGINTGSMSRFIKGINELSGENCLVLNDWLRDQIDQICRGTPNQ